MVTDKFNPKFKLLDSPSQMLWFLYLIIKDHEKHEFYYSMEKLEEITGRARKTIIKSNNELEYHKIMSSKKAHRTTTIYKMKEKIRLTNGDTSFLLSVDVTPKTNSLSVDSTPIECKDYTQKPVLSVDSTPIECKDYTPSIDLSINNLSNNIIIEQNDDDIIKYAEDIADRKAELSEQIFFIQKAIITRYSLNGFHKPPSYQFIKDLLHINEQYGGFNYVLGKVNEMPIPLEPKEIGQTLRGYCQHPEKGNNGKQIKQKSFDIQREEQYKERERWEKEHANSDPKKISDLLQNLFAKFGDV